MGWQEDWGFTGGSGERDLGEIEYIEGVGHRRAYTNSKGERVYRALNLEEQKATGKTNQSDATRVADDKAAGREERLMQHQTMLQGKSDQRFETQLAQQNSQFQASLSAQLEQARASSAAQMAGIANQGIQLKNNHELGLAGLAQQGEQHKDAMTIRNDELRMTREQIQANNVLQGRKLDMEDRHFQQQAALDHKNSRRTQVMNALTLIAQSAAKL